MQVAHDGAHVWLTPLAGPAVTVVATSDLHRHHDDKYIDRDSLSLAEWFEQAAPARVDVALFPGDLGLDLNGELSDGLVRGVDRRATGARITPRENDGRTVESWRRLIARCASAHAPAHAALLR